MLNLYMITTDRICNVIKKQSASKGFVDKAAVLIPIILNENSEISIVFEVRAPHLRTQPNDICLPGGKMEASDLSPIDTAIRETTEELGIAARDLKIYGQLPSFFSPLGLKIYPVVGELTSKQFDLNINEVSEIFTVPLSWFIKNPPLKTAMELAYRPASHFPFELLPAYSKHWQKRSQHDIYIYHYHNYVIWGLTAQIIRLFLQTLESERNYNDQ